MRKVLDKKGVSTMVEYVLLIVIAISLSVVVYAWLKNYIPKTTADCPDSVSIVISDYKCNSGMMTISYLNKGNFNIEGYILRVTNISGGQKYTVLSKETLDILGTKQFYNYFYFGGRIESLKPNEEYSSVIDYTGYKQIESIEIQPFTFAKNQVVLCGKAIVSQKIDNCR